MDNRRTNLCMCTIMYYCVQASSLNYCIICYAFLFIKFNGAVSLHINKCKTINYLQKPFWQVFQYNSNTFQVSLQIDKMFAFVVLIVMVFCAPYHIHLLLPHPIHCQEGLHCILATSSSSSTCWPSLSVYRVSHNFQVWDIQKYFYL